MKKYTDNKHIAIVVASDAFDRKGLFNAVIGRARVMKESGRYDVDVFCIQCRDSVLSRMIRHTVKPTEICDYLDVNGLKVNLLWHRFSIIDYILFSRLHLFRPFWNLWTNRHASVLKGYDIVSAHSFDAACFASHSGVSFFTTWHGSDIHTHPFRNPAIMKETRRLMKESSCNIFVSKCLMKQSDKILPDCQKFASANGIDSAFVSFGTEEKKKCRELLGLKEGETGIGYAGNFMKVKNVTLLPDLFAEISSKVKNCRFFCVGDGKLRVPVEKSMPVPCLFTGNLAPESMPAFYNAMDMTVLPSLNEGFPLVCAEALSCGCKVVGSNVGAIPEIIGEANTADPNDVHFVQKLAGIAVRELAEENHSIHKDYSWHSVFLREEEIIQSIIQGQPE